jgi:signal peptidase II
MRIANPKLFRLAMALATIVILADQASKWAIAGLFTDPYQVIELTPFFNLVAAHNTGVSFSMLQGMGPWLLILGATGVSLALIGWLAKLTTPLPALAVGLVVGGALGNVIDRIRLGAVFDFLDFYLGNWHFPAFNLADSAISVGVFLLLLDGLFHRADQGKTERS